MSPVGLTIDEFCQVICSGRSKAFALIREGEVDVVRLGRKTLVTIDSIERMIERNMVRGRF